MKIALEELYKQTLAKNKINPQQLPFMDFLKQVYINLKKQGNKEGVEQIEKMIDDSITLYSKGLDTFNLEQLENLKEFTTIEKNIVEKRIKAIEKKIEEKNATNSQQK